MSGVVHRITSYKSRTFHSDDCIGESGAGRWSQSHGGVLEYRCHVFSMFDACLPEGRQTMEFVAPWMRQQREEGSS
jgi:hypothetical protein